MCILIPPLTPCYDILPQASIHCFSFVCVLIPFLTPCNDILLQASIPRFSFVCILIPLLTPNNDILIEASILSLREPKPFQISFYSTTKQLRGIVLVWCETTLHQSNTPALFVCHKSIISQVKNECLQCM